MYKIDKGDLLMNYFVIDFETANSNRNSACALGIVEVKNNIIVNEWDYLIDPEDYFDSFNVFIHGITPEMVEGKPTLKELWPEIKLILSDKIVIAHNASFDISVLRWSLSKYNIEFPNFKYSCTRILAKKTWPSLVNYKLDTIANYLGIDFIHHQACEDAKATAKVFDAIVKSNEINDFEALHQKLKVKIGSIYKDGYSPAKVKSSGNKNYIKPKDIVPTVDTLDESHELYNKGICFTGTLTHMVRKDAAQEAVNRGAIYCNSVNKKTNYLVMGVQDYSKFVDGKKSSKLKKAEELISKGQDLEIIGEDEFIRLL